MPGPGVGNDLLQPPGGLPAQDFRRSLVGGDEHRRIPRPAGLQLGGDLPAGDFPGGVDDAVVAFVGQSVGLDSDHELSKLGTVCLTTPQDWNDQIIFTKKRGINIANSRNDIHRG